MAYFIEVWLRKDLEEYIKTFSTFKDNYYPHITLVRPFDINTSEQDIQQRLISVCKNQLPIPYSIEGKGEFGEVKYFPITHEKELLNFSNKLEQRVQNSVLFSPRLGEKTLHITVDYDKDIKPCPKIDSYMLRMTVLKDKLVWFSYDFVLKTCLNREKSKDPGIYELTQKIFARSLKD